MYWTGAVRLSQPRLGNLRPRLRIMFPNRVHPRGTYLEPLFVDVPRSDQIARRVQRDVPHDAGRANTPFNGNWLSASPEILRRPAISSAAFTESQKGLMLPSRLLMLLWTVILASFPLIALVGSEEAPALEYIPIVGIAAGAVAAVYRCPFERWLPVAATCVGFTAVYYLAFQLFAESSYPEKIQLFLLVIVAFGVMLGVCLQDDRFLNRLPTAFLVIGGIAVILLALDPSAHQEGRGSFGDGNPIWMARTVAFAGIAAVWHLTRKQSLWAWLVLAAAAGAIAFTGSRGPLVALAAAAAYAFVFLHRGQRGPIFVLSGYLLAILLAIQVGFEVIPDLRAFSFTSANGRDVLYQYAMDLIILNPMGIGVGNFSYHQFSYPHNIVLEFLVEWGWFLGGTILVVIVWGGARLLRSPPEFDILKLAFIIEMLNAQFSGDITTPRMLYALVFVGLFFRPGAPIRNNNHALNPACATMH